MAFRLIDYIFTPVDLYRILRSAGWKNIIIILVLIVIALYAKAHTGLSSEAIIFSIVITFIFLVNIDMRMPIALALSLLIFVPILLVLSYTTFPRAEIVAEQIGMWAFYLLIIGASKYTWEYIRERKLEQIIPSGSKKIHVVTSMLKKHAAFLGHQRLEVIPPIKKPTTSPKNITIKVKLTKHSKTPEMKKILSMDGIVLRRKSNDQI